MNRLHFAVVVGINRYPGIVNQLTTARQDAVAFAEWLCTPGEGGVPDDQIAVITADATEEAGFGDYWDARPVRQDVIRALARFHAAVARVSPRDWPSTRLYLYVAGHGLVPPAGRGALVFADASPPGYWSELLDLGEYERLYDRFTPFHDVVLLADCCRETPHDMPVVSSPPFSGPHRGPTRCVLGFATQHGRRAGAPRARDGRGFFTTALLEGLRGEGPHDPDTGVINSDHLAQHIRRRVPDLASAHDYAQQAEIIMMRGGPIELSRVTPTQYRVSVRLPPGRIDRARIVRWENQDQILLYDKDARGGFTTSLPNGLYEVIFGRSSKPFKVLGGDTAVEL